MINSRLDPTDKKPVNVRHGSRTYLKQNTKEKTGGNKQPQ